MPFSNPYSGPARRVMLAFGSALALSACTTVESSQWNLAQLHTADGSTRRVGELRNGFQQALTQFIGKTEFKVPFIEGITSAKPIDDPLGRCLHNLNGLLVDAGNNALLRAEQISTVTWLAEGCDYALSRERCALSIASLGAPFSVNGPAEVDDSLKFSSAEELGKAIGQLILAAAPELTEHPEAADQIPGLAAQCQSLRSLNLDRNGARRLLVSCAALLQRTKASKEGRPALEALHLHAAQNCLGLALASAINDPSPLVRAAGLGAWIDLTAGEDPRPYALALGSSVPENIQVAIEGFSIYGIPPSPSRSPESQSSTGELQTERYWSGVLTQLLDSLREGPGAVSLCHGMSQLTGLDENLRPEYWIAWQLDQEALLQSQVPSP